MITVIQVAKILRIDGTADEYRCLVVGEDGRVVDRVADASSLGILDSEIRLLDESSCSLMPLLADSHMHLGISDGLVESDQFHRLDFVEYQLANYLAAGVGHVLSLGTDQPWVQSLSKEYLDGKASHGAFPYSAGCGFGAAAGWPPELTRPQLRYRPTDPETARQHVRELHRDGVAILKLWVDDLGGTVPKMPLAISQAIIDESHRHGLKVCAHIFAEVDARELIAAGIDALAHSVRDGRVDLVFAETMANQGVRLIPTLVREEAALTFASESNPYLNDSFFRHSAGHLLHEVAVQRITLSPKEADKAKRSLDVAAYNLATLSREGVEVCLGTDAGFRLKLPGFSQHRELQLMVFAGLTQTQALAAAMKNNYRFFATGASDLSNGQPADFLLLKGDPLADIRCTTKIHQVWRDGALVHQADAA